MGEGYLQDFLLLLACKTVTTETEFASRTTILGCLDPNDAQLGSLHSEQTRSERASFHQVDDVPDGGERESIL